MRIRFLAAFAVAAADPKAYPRLALNIAARAGQAMQAVALDHLLTTCAGYGELLARRCLGSIDHASRPEVQSVKSAAGVLTWAGEVEVLPLAQGGSARITDGQITEVHGKWAERTKGTSLSPGHLPGSAVPSAASKLDGGRSVPNPAVLVNDEAGHDEAGRLNIDTLRARFRLPFLWPAVTLSMATATA